MSVTSSNVPGMICAQTACSPRHDGAGFVPKVLTSGKHRASLPYPEVNGFLQALRECGAGQLTKLGLEFLILTAGRSVEIREALWKEVNFAARQWTIPAGA